MSKSGKFWTSFQNLPAMVSFRLAGSCQIWQLNIPGLSAAHQLAIKYSKRLSAAHQLATITASYSKHLTLVGHKGSLTSWVCCAVQPDHRLLHNIVDTTVILEEDVREGGDSQLGTHSWGVKKWGGQYSTLLHHMTITASYSKRLTIKVLKGSSTSVVPCPLIIVQIIGLRFLHICDSIFPRYYSAKLVTNNQKSKSIYSLLRCEMQPFDWSNLRQMLSTFSICVHMLHCWNIMYNHFIIRNIYHCYCHATIIHDTFYLIQLLTN